MYAEQCRIGEVILIGEPEARTVINKGSLVFRFPLERDYLRQVPSNPWKGNLKTKEQTVTSEVLAVCGNQKKNTRENPEYS